MRIPEVRMDLIRALTNSEWELVFTAHEDEDVDKELTDEEFERVSEAFFVEASAEELHLFMQLWNWEGELLDLERVVSHPTCDLGTALMAYWLCQPDFYLKYADRREVPRRHQSYFDFLSRLEIRVQTGQYQTASFAFDPADFEGQNWLPQADAFHKRKIPSEMYGPWYKAN